MTDRPVSEGFVTVVPTTQTATGDLCDSKDVSTYHKFQQLPGTVSLLWRVHEVSMTFMQQSYLIYLGIQISVRLLLIHRSGIAGQSA